MHVVIIGITGRLGKRIAAELERRGHTVRGVNRRPERVPVVLGTLPVTTMVGDTADYARMVARMQGADVVMPVFPPSLTHPETYAGELRNVLDAVKQAGVRRVVGLVGSSGALVPTGSAW